MPSKKTGTKYETGKIPEPFQKTEYHHYNHVWDRFKKTKAYKLCLAKDLLYTFSKWVVKEYRFEKK